MKSNRLNYRALERGFTLVELLVVITIIAILASLAVPVTNKVIQNANNLRIKATMKDIQVAISHYRTEYNRFPLTLTGASGGDDTAPILTSGQTNIINVLMARTDPNQTPNLNARNIKFIDLPFAKNAQTFGVIDPSGGAGTTPLQLVDIWGMPYKIMLDTNYDNRITNPDASNVDQKISARAPKFLSTSTAVQSYGPDKIANTKDDIASWR
ncbi:MAG: prepilin-type N-terminal cleavage/methylation domain-containing protein [Verrucomicrobia bacterium]|nr:prepilin-type N-terminal cleavage/methylation domain-containing protein [Verrucomicrobiota bacterium]